MHLRRSGFSVGSVRVPQQVGILGIEVARHGMEQLLGCIGLETIAKSAQSLPHLSVASRKLHACFF